MAAQHPDLAEEQAYIDHAYACLELSRQDAWKMRNLTESGMGGTFQNRFERNAIDDALVKRLTDLDLGDAALVFGRIDRHDGENLETFHIGRLAVSDETREPVVVDWRAPVAEPFYRATGRQPMGLARRRHFVVQASRLLGIEDELFGQGHLGIGHDEGLDGLLGGETPETLVFDDDGVGVTQANTGLRGYSALLASIERGRTGRLGDIVATIQAEQDEIIRSPQAGVLVVQGGPGTGKTVVALHRAAYLLYTNRFPLEDQGVLVIGPNRVFLRYIEQVLPSLGEAGVEQVVLQDLVPGVLWATESKGRQDSVLAERVKGDERMADVIEKAVRDRQRPLRESIRVPFRSGYVTLRAEETQRIVQAARRRYRRHNSARRWVENEVWSALAATWRDGDADAEEVRESLRRDEQIWSALERMWPVLSPAQLLHDFFGSRALLKLGAHRYFSEVEIESLYRERSSSLDEVRWTRADTALLDEARVHLGPKAKKNGKTDEADEIRTYGHIVVDEVQDLTPMQLAMVTRRSLSGSMTVVGDLAQATGVHAPSSWDELLDHLPDVKNTRVIGLSVSYRIPGQIMDLANRVMLAASPSLRPPTSVRAGTALPEIVTVGETGSLSDTVIAETRRLVEQVQGGNVAVIVPDALADSMSAAFTQANFEHGRAATSALDSGVTVVPVSMVKGLELDGVLVVEPADIVKSELHGLRALYVALTRPTQRLTVVHQKQLPASMQSQPGDSLV